MFARPDGLPKRPSDVSYTVTKAVRRLGLPEVGVHGLRHTNATLAIPAGVPAPAHPSDDREAAHPATAGMLGTKVGSWDALRGPDARVGPLSAETNLSALGGRVGRGARGGT